MAAVAMLTAVGERARQTAMRWPRVRARARVIAGWWVNHDGNANQHGSDGTNHKPKEEATLALG